ncbi:MAG: hypothetical protein ABFQ82_04345 [Thermodesulfobacteriota bacterium]
MGHKHDLLRKKKRRAKTKADKPVVTVGTGNTRPPRLEIVLKCEAAGSLQAVAGAISSLPTDGVEIVVISSGIGEISKSDIMMAETGSRLIIGYEIKVGSKIEEQLIAAGIEARLYSVIYRLADDLHQLCLDYTERGPVETIKGEARVIALFKGSRKGIILGCQVERGVLARGDRFRVINAMGEAYNGRIESLHIGDHAVLEAKTGQQVGLKINDLKKGAIGDRVESFSRQQSQGRAWQPQPGVKYSG